MEIALGARGPTKGDEELFVNKVKNPDRSPLYKVQTDYYLNTGWQIFKLYPWGFIGFSAIELMVIGVSLILWKKFGLLMGLLLDVGTYPLHMGIWIVSAKLLQKQPCVFRDFFSGFHYFKPLVIFGFFYSIINGLDYLLPQQTSTIILNLVVSLVFVTIYFFTPLLIIDRRLTWWRAMELSWRTVQCRFLGILGLNILLGLIWAGGIIALGVGLLVTHPLVYCAITVAYADIFGFSSEKY